MVGASQRAPRAHPFPFSLFPPRWRLIGGSFLFRGVISRSGGTGGGAAGFAVEVAAEAEVERAFEVRDVLRIKGTSNATYSTVRESVVSSLEI